jgi:4a-hydroxytetrahydrobiopterin dehydratase
VQNPGRSLPVAGSRSGESCVKLFFNTVTTERTPEMSTLAQKECVPCKGAVPPLKGPELARLAGELGGGWQITCEHHLEKEFKFKDFCEALAFTNKVGQLAEAQGHHPDIYLAWGKVRLTIWTHMIDGLTESDFVLAAKADRL